MKQKIAIIIGAGPAGLTAAYELLCKTNIKPVIYEMDDTVGGISRTVNYKGNRLDIGGHRFFSKSDRVMRWWQNILPLQEAPATSPSLSHITYRNQKKSFFLPQQGPDPEKSDQVMLIRRRLSRIVFDGKLFDYPLSLNAETLMKLGIRRVIKIAFSYIKARISPIRAETSLEDFLINRFGRELYNTFFKDYTEKVWGVSAREIKPEWGVQRIKGLSVGKALFHSLKGIFQKYSSIEQKETETSLIEQFLYPKFGPGQMWEEVAKIIRGKGGEIYFQHTIVGLQSSGRRVLVATARNEKTGELVRQNGDYFFSTMPIKELIRSFQAEVPPDIQKIAYGLRYRDFITVGLLLRKFDVRDKKSHTSFLPDNWLYIQEKNVKVGRIQIFNNWSPYMVKDPDTVWIGLEYFCNEGDEVWRKTDNQMSLLAIDELEKIRFINKNDVLDSHIVRMKKTYPAYTGTYDQLDMVRQFLDRYENLFLIGRNGMHKYNNQDHSMLTAMAAVENIINNIKTKDNIWAINAEQEYHEKKSESR